MSSCRGACDSENGPAHELTIDELARLWAQLPRGDREVLSAAIVDKVFQPQLVRTLSQAVERHEGVRRRQIKLAQARLRRLKRWQEIQANGGAPAANGRPKARQSRYSVQQLQALSRAWDRFAPAGGAEHEDAPARVGAFVRALEPRLRAWLPKMVKADTVRKLVQQEGSSGRPRRPGARPPRSPTHCIGSCRSRRAGARSIASSASWRACGRELKSPSAA